MYQIPMLEFLYGEEDLSVSDPNWLFDLIYEDDLVAVYDLQGARSAELPDLLAGY